MDHYRIRFICMIFAVIFLTAGIIPSVQAQITSFSPAQPAAEYRTENYANGDQYTGYFADGKYNGEGTYIWANGDRYEGEFMNGQIDGAGRLTFFGNGQYWEGLFVLGQISSGSGVFFWGSNGDKFDGQWINGQPDGTGILLHPDGTSNKVTFANGVLTGQIGTTAGGNQSQYGSQSQYGGSSKVYAPFQGLQAGGTVAFGSFEQDNNLYNGKEPIIWKVLMIYDGRALLLSRDLLEAMPYNYVQTPIVWESSSIRTWLNEAFYNDAFSSEEKSYISRNWNDNPANNAYGTYGGSRTFDDVFLLSMDELLMYFPSEASRKASPTAVARAHGAYGTADRNCAWWWLRSPGQYTSCATSVNSIGVLLNTGPIVTDTTGGIRPAIWVNLGY